MDAYGDARQAEMEAMRKKMQAELNAAKVQTTNHFTPFVTTDVV